MLEPPSSTTMPRWISRAILGCLLLGVGYACTSIALAATGGPVLPPPANVIITIGLATTLALLFEYGLQLQLHARIELAEGRTSRRLDVISNGMIEHGIVLEAITGEIPRIRPLVIACAHGDDIDAYAKGFADGLAREPMADANVIPITGRN
jgi:hypothetical protein